MPLLSERLVREYLCEHCESAFESEGLCVDILPVLYFDHLHLIVIFEQVLCII